MCVRIEKNALKRNFGIFNSFVCGVEKTFSVFINAAFKKRAATERLR